MKRFLLPLFLLITTSAGAVTFPTTGILDSGIRANEQPLSDSGRWTNQNNGLQVFSNQITGFAGAFAGAYRNNVAYGPDVEEYVTLTTKATTTGDFLIMELRYDPVNSNGYQLWYTRNTSGSDTLQIEKEVFGTSSTLSSVFNQNIGNGDTLGFSAVGNLLTIWYKASGGSWTVIGTVTDSTYAGASGDLRILEMFTVTTMAFNNFGGGTYVPTSIPPTTILYKTTLYNGRIY